MGDKSPLEEWVDNFLADYYDHGPDCEDKCCVNVPKFRDTLLEKLGEQFDAGRKCGLYEADQWWD